MTTTRAGTPPAEDLVERNFLEDHGAARAMVGERELAVSMARHALRRFGVPHDMGAVAARALRIGEDGSRRKEPDGLPEKAQRP